MTDLKDGPGKYINPSPRRDDEIDSRFPLLVDNVSWSHTDAPGNLAVADPGGVARQTLRSALGWSGNDAAGFTSALSASIELGERSGHVTSTWVKRTVSVQADLGALTGAQASLFTRAQAAQPLINSLIANLQILDPALDADDANAVRDLVSDTVTDLIAELGNPGNPRVARVDTLFEILTGLPRSMSAQVVKADMVGGALGNLRTSWGLVRHNANSLDEEETLTNFVTLVDSICSGLMTPWSLQRSAFAAGAGSDTFLGPELVLLSRDLAAAAEQCQDCRMLLRSVLLGEAEQATILVNAAGSQRGAMPLTDLMDWLEDFLNHRGPQMITKGGRDAIASAFVPMARTLQDLVHSIVVDPDPNWPPGMSAGRVASAFASLDTFMTQVLARVGKVTRYGVSVTGVEGALTAGEVGVITLRGAGLDVVRGVTFEHDRVTIEGHVVSTMQSRGQGGEDTATVLFNVVGIPPNRIPLEGTWVRLEVTDNWNATDTSQTVRIKRGGPPSDSSGRSAPPGPDGGGPSDSADAIASPQTAETAEKGSTRRPRTTGRAASKATRAKSNPKQN